MNNPLGHHIISWPSSAKDTVRRAPGACLKLVGCDAIDREMVQWYKQARPDGLVIYRPYFQYEDLSHPREWARQALAECEPIRQWVDYLEGENERYQTRRHDAFKRYNDWSCEYGDELHQHGAKYLCLSSSSWNPTLEILPDYYDAFRMADAIATHCYWWRRLADGGGYYYRDILAALPTDCRKRVILTECGADSGQRQGWQTAYASEPNPAEAFATDLLHYAGELLKDGVIGAVFSLGCRPDFQDFEYSGVAPVLAVMNTRLATPPPTNEANNTSTGGNEGGNNMPNDDIRLYADWSLARIANGEDPRSLADFRAHLAGLGKDAGAPTDYGFPFASGGVVGSPDVAAINAHAEAISGLVSPFL